LAGVEGTGCKLWAMPKRRKRDEVAPRPPPRAPVFVPNMMPAVPPYVPPNFQPQPPSNHTASFAGAGANFVGAAALLPLPPMLPPALEQVARGVEQQLASGFAPPIVAGVMRRVRQGLGSGSFHDEDALIAAVQWCSQEAAPAAAPAGGGAGGGGEADEDDEADDRNVDMARELALETAASERKMRSLEQRKSLIKCDLRNEAELKEAGVRGSSLLKNLRKHSGFSSAAAATAGCNEDARGDKGQKSDALELKCNIVEMLLLEAKTVSWYKEYATAFIDETAEQLRLIFDPRGGSGAGGGVSSSSSDLKRQAKDVKVLLKAWQEGLFLETSGKIPTIIIEADKRARAAAGASEGGLSSQDGEAATEIQTSVQIREERGVVVID